MSGLSAPVHALIGVFIEPGNPLPRAAPPSLDFADFSSRNYTRLSPQLRQPFFISDGMTDSGTRQHVVVPSKNARLYLGIMDINGLYNFNLGELNVRVSRGPTGIVALR